MRTSSALSTGTITSSLIALSASSGGRFGLARLAVTASAHRGTTHVIRILTFKIAFSDVVFRAFWLPSRCRTSRFFRLFCRHRYVTHSSRPSTDRPLPPWPRKKIRRNTRTDKKDRSTRTTPRRTNWRTSSTTSATKVVINTGMLFNFFFLHWNLKPVCFSVVCRTTRWRSRQETQSVRWRRHGHHRRRRTSGQPGTIRQAQGGHHQDLRPVRKDHQRLLPQERDRPHDRVSSTRPPTGFFRLTDDCYYRAKCFRLVTYSLNTRKTKAHWKPSPKRTTTNSTSSIRF